MKTKELMTAATQQFALYRAESRCSAGRRFGSHAEIQAYVDDLVGQSWWPERHHKVATIEAPAVRRQDSAGTYFADECVGHIEIGSDMSERTVLHEVAHVTAAADGSTCHDPAFARHYLELVFRQMGTDAWMTLRQSFIDEGVEFDV